MAVLHPKNRKVFFRLSQEEFHQLATLCEGAEGARSVSELSRSAVRKLILHEVSDANGEMKAAIERVEKTVSELSQKLEQLIEMIHRGDGVIHGNGER